MKFIPLLLACTCTFDLYVNCEMDFSTYSPFIVTAMRLPIVFINISMIFMILFNTYPIQVHACL